MTLPTGRLWTMFLTPMPVRALPFSWSSSQCSPGSNPSLCIHTCLSLLYIFPVSPYLPFVVPVALPFLQVYRACGSAPRASSSLSCWHQCCISRWTPSKAHPSCQHAGLRACSVSDYRQLCVSALTRALISLASPRPMPPCCHHSKAWGYCLHGALCDGSSVRGFAGGAGSKLSETVLPVPDNVSSEEQDGLCDLQQPDGDAQSGISAPGEGAQGAPGGPRTELEGPQMHGADGEVGRGVDMTSSQGAPATEGDESGEGEWEVAARSGMAARRRRRRARRYAAASAFPSVRCPPCSALPHRPRQRRGGACGCAHACLCSAETACALSGHMDPRFLFTHRDCL